MTKSWGWLTFAALFLLVLACSWTFRNDPVFLIALSLPVLLIILALVNGVRILRQSRQEYGSNAMTLRLLALNLIEPAINSIIITGLVFYHPVTRTVTGAFTIGFLITAPMIILIAGPIIRLLLSIVHLTSDDTVCRAITIKLAMLGMLRLSVAAINFMVVLEMMRLRNMLGMVPSNFFWIMSHLCLLLSYLVLGYSIYWVKRQPAKLVQPYAIGVGADGVMVGDVSDFSQANRPRIRL